MGSHDDVGNDDDNLMLCEDAINKQSVLTLPKVNVVDGPRDRFVVVGTTLKFRRGRWRDFVFMTLIVADSIF